MKKIILSLFAVLLSCCAWAYSVNVDGIYYNFNSDDKTAEVTFRSNTYRSYSGDVVIPSSVTYSDVTYRVTSIGYNAFRESNNLTSVTIPNSITSIGASAFSSCTSLASIEIPSSVTSIGDYSFHNTAWYNNQPDGLIYIGKSAYKYKGTMPENTSIVIKEGTKEIVGGAFQDCAGLISVMIPNGVTRIGNRAFYGCFNLPSIEIPSSVTSIDKEAFIGCAYLTSIKVADGNTVYDSRGNCNALIETASNTLIAGCENTVIPDGIQSINDCAFMYCVRLASINIPSSVTSIGKEAFFYCIGLTSIDLPNSVTYVGKDAFEETPWYKNLPDGLLYIGKVAYKYIGTMPEKTNLKLKENTTYIANAAFSDCTGMTSVTIPNSVTSIEYGAFSGCSGLASIKVEEGNTVYDSRNNCNAIIETASDKLVLGCKNTKIPNGLKVIGIYSFKGCTGLVSVEVPEGVLYLEAAFQDCTNLTTVYLPQSLERMGDYVFKGCMAIKDVYCLAKDVPDDKDNVFTGADVKTATLHVPEASVINYKYSTNWGRFGNIVAIDMTEIQSADATKEEKNIEQIFTLDGHESPTLQKGMNIVKYSDGSTKKQIVK